MYLNNLHEKIIKLLQQKMSGFLTKPIENDKNNGKKRKWD